MKEKVPILVGVTAATIGVLAVTLMGQTGITGSAHDFSDVAGNWAEGEICLPCHTPHGANTDVAAPLWNHALTEQVFALYGGGSAPADEALDSKSVLCMSCHDGITALDSFGGKTGTILMQGSAVIGTDLSNDHPVGATAVYPDQGPNSRMRPASEWEGWGPRGGMWRQPLNGDMVVGCTTCHNVHNTVHKAMARRTLDGSDLCLACHIK